MLFKRPNNPINDLHKLSLGRKNPLYGRQAQLAQPAMYNGHTLLHPDNTPAFVPDSDVTLAQVEANRAKMSEKP